MGHFLVETESLSPIQPFSRWALSILGSRSSSTYDLSGSRDVIGHVNIWFPHRLGLGNPHPRVVAVGSVPLDIGGLLERSLSVTVLALHSVCFKDIQWRLANVTQCSRSRLNDL